MQPGSVAVFPMNQVHCGPRNDSDCIRIVLFAAMGPAWNEEAVTVSGETKEAQGSGTRNALETS